MFLFFRSTRTWTYPFRPATTCYCDNELFNDVRSEQYTISCWGGTAAGGAEWHAQWSWPQSIHRCQPDSEWLEHDIAVFSHPSAGPEFWWWALLRVPVAYWCSNCRYVSLDTSFSTRWANHFVIFFAGIWYSRYRDVFFVISHPGCTSVFLLITWGDHCIVF